MQLFDAEKYGLTRDESNEWDERIKETTNYWEWFDGTKLKERRKDVAAGPDGLTPFKYPLQINPLALAARLHSYALFGETPDTEDPLVKTLCRSDDAALADKANEILLQIQYDNDSRAQDTDAGLSIQSLGGMFCKIGYDPNSHILRNKIRYEYVDPRDVHCRWAGRQYFDITELWVRRYIAPHEAARYGVKTDTKVWYVERWNTKNYEIWVDGQVVDYYDNQPLVKNHHFGVCPWVYTPHERANEFWGISLASGVEGLIAEVNSRSADVGDAIQSGVIDTPVGRNIRAGHPQIQTLADGRRWLNIGRGNAQYDQPDMFRVGAAQLPSDAKPFVDGLVELTRITLLTPETAYGKLEGTQRSGSTLHSILWPMLSHVRQERTYWTAALNRRARIALTILAKRNLFEITEEHAALSMRQIWSPMVPIDRAQLVQEIVSLLTAHGISTELAVERLQHAVDNKAEVKLIFDNIKRMAELSAVNKETDGNGESKPTAKPNPAAAK